MIVRSLVHILWIAWLAQCQKLLQESTEQDEAAGKADYFLAVRRVADSRRIGEVAVNDDFDNASSSNEADDNVNDSNITETRTTTTTATATASTTTSMSLLAARISGHFEFVADRVDDEAVEFASEVSLSEALGVAVWQLNVTVLPTETSWHVLYTVDLGAEFRQVLVAGHRVLVDSSSFQAILSQELARRSTSPQRVTETFNLLVFAALQIQEIDPAILNSTSTTATSLTQTTTTTTQTVLVSLKLLSATVREPFNSVLFGFNVPARFTAPSDGTGCRSAAFSTQTWESLGHLPHCRWVNASQLEIRFGKGATAQLGQILVTSPAGFEPMGNVAFLDSPPFQAVLEAEAMGRVTPRLSHPTAVQSCSRVTFSILGSRGGAGRPLQVKWSINLPTFTVVKDSLQAMVDAANAEGSRALEFPPENFSVAVQRARIVLGEISYAKVPIHVNITAQVSNWLGATTSASGMVTVLKEEEPLPVLVATSPKAQHVATQEETIFSIMTLSNKLSECVDPLNTSSLNVKVEWEYKPDAGRIWHSLQTLQNLTDISNTPNTVRFAPFTFPPNTAHQFRVLVQYEGTTVMRRPNITFNLTVASRQPPVAKIQGPSEVGASCPFVLNASQSRDDWSRDAELVFNWSCAPLDGAGSCNVQNFAEANFARADGSGANGALMNVHGGQLATGRYIFGLSVSRQSDSLADAGNATIEVRVVAGARPAISIAVPWETEAGVSVASDVGMLGMVTAHVDQTRGCSVPSTWASRFLLVEHVAPFEVLAFLAFFTTTSTTMSTTTTQTTTTTSTTSVTTTSTTEMWDNESLSEGRNVSDSDILGDEEDEVEDDNGSLGDWQNISTDGVMTDPERLTFTTNDFPRGLLTPGRLYSYAIIFADADELAALEGNDTSDLESLSRIDSVAVAVSVPFQADSPPRRGRVIVAPLLGQALVTAFRIATADWEDEDAELEYAFYRFPVKGSDGPSPEGEGFESWMHRFEMPDIEWNDASHPSHWRKQGGVLMRSFSTTPTLEEMRLPAGAFYVIVRARDSTNAVGTEFLAAPLVTAVADVDESSMVELLDAAQSSNDANSIINAVDTVVSSAPTASEDTAQLSLQLLLQAAALLNSPEVATKCVEVVTAVLIGVWNGGHTVESATLQSASLAIDGALDALDMVNTDAAEKGQLVLEGIGTIGAATVATAQSLDTRDSARLTAQVDSLTAKLASRMLSQLGQGQVQQVNAGDATGTGGGSGLKVGKLGRLASPNVRRLNSVSCSESSKLMELSVLQMVHPLLASDFDSATPSLPASGPNVEFQDGVWRSTNMYTWANPALGVNAHVPADATIRSFTASACGGPVTLFNLSDPLHVRLTLPPPGSPPTGYFLMPACAKWHEADSAWKMEDLQVQDVETATMQLTCVSYEGTGVYTAFHSPTPEPTSTSTTSTASATTSTSSTATWTSSTATRPLTVTVSSRTITSTSVVWWATAVTTLDMNVPFCSESVMPPSPPGAAPFTCYGPRRVGQECRAKCDPDPLKTETAAISCRADPFTGTLSWAFSAVCPSPTEMPLVVTTETPTTNFEVMNTYGIIALATLALFLCLALCCSLSWHLRAAGLAKASRVAPDVPQKPSEVSDRSLASQKSVRTASDQLLFQTWAVESAKCLPSPTFRNKSEPSEPTQPARPGADDEPSEPPAHAGDLHALTVEGSFWDWAKEWSHASIVQVAVPDPALQLSEQVPAPDEDADAEMEEEEEEEDDVGEMVMAQALLLQNIGSDSESPRSPNDPKALTM